MSLTQHITINHFDAYCKFLKIEDFITTEGDSFFCCQTELLPLTNLIANGFSTLMDKKKEDAIIGRLFILEKDDIFNYKITKSFFEQFLPTDSQYSGPNSTIDMRINRLNELISCMRDTTQPLINHTDPKSVIDCWKEIEFMIASIKSCIRRDAFDFWTRQNTNYDNLLKSKSMNQWHLLKEDNLKENYN